MKWLDPRSLLLGLFLIYLLIVAAMTLVTMVVLWVVRYWWVLVFIIGAVLLIRWLFRWNRDRLGRW